MGGREIVRLTEAMKTAQTMSSSHGSFNVDLNCNLCISETNPSDEVRGER